jgi:hypothetical protein
MFISLPVLTQLLQAKRRNSRQLKISLAKKRPKIPEKGSGINITPAEFELHNSRRENGITEPFEHRQLVPLDIYLH